MKIALALLFNLAAGAAHAGERVEYRRFGGDVLGSDGSVAHTFGGETTITRPGRKTIRCHTFGGRDFCEDR